MNIKTKNFLCWTNMSRKISVDGCEVNLIALIIFFFTLCNPELWIQLYNVNPQNFTSSRNSSEIGVITYKLFIISDFCNVNNNIYAIVFDTLAKISPQDQATFAVRCNEWKHHCTGGQWKDFVVSRCPSTCKSVMLMLMIMMLMQVMMVMGWWWWWCLSYNWLCWWWCQQQ